MTEKEARNQVEALRTRIRPAVRRENVYAVRSYDGLIAKLNQNESADDLPADLKDAIVNALRSIPWNRYPTDYADPAREKLAETLGVSPDAIILSNGSNDLIYSVSSALIAPDTPAVLPDPLFSLYGKAVRLLDGNLVEVPCHPDFHLDIDGLIEASRKHDAPIVMVANPGSPTGAYDEIDSIKQLAGAVPGFLLVDEAYHEFVSGSTALDLIADFPNVIVLRTFSKAIGLAGLRIGYVVGHPDIVNEIRKVRLPFVLNVLSEATMMAVLDRPGYVSNRVNEVTEEREKLYGLLDAMPGVDVRSSNTNFLILKTAIPAGELVDRIANRGVLIRNVSGYRGLEGFVRVTIGTPAENQAFMVALTNTLAED